VKTTLCRGCGKPIVFVVVQKEDGEEGRAILDFRAPVYEVVTDGDDRTIVRRSKTAAVSHFATCPKANEFSGSKKKAAP
jgi:hypothetical protein